MEWSQVLIIIGSLGAFGAWIWTRLDRRFDLIDRQFEKVNLEFKEIRDEMKELRTSLNRIEGAFYSKDCCMLKDEKHEKKAE